MNLLHSPHNSVNVEAAQFNRGVVNFSSTKAPEKARKKGWICNLSHNYVFSQQHHEFLQIQATGTHSQFTLMCKLLKAETCRIIYFDDKLTAEQLLKLRKIQQFSQTEIIHAKVAFMFSANVSTLYG